MSHIRSNSIRDKNKQEAEKGKDKKKQMQADFLAKMRGHSVSQQDALDQAAEVLVQPQEVVISEQADKGNTRDYKRSAQKAERRAQEAEAAVRSEVKAHQATERNLEEKKKEIKTLKEKGQELAEHIQMVKSTAETAVAECQAARFERDAMAAELERKIQELEQLVNKITKERDDARNNSRHTMRPSVPFMINALRSSMTIHNLDQYEPLEELLEQKKQMSIHRRRPEWYREISPMLRERMYQSALYDYGYMTKKENDWYFCNLNNTCYPLDIYNVEPVEDSPAKVLLVDNVAYLTYVYGSDEKLRGNMIRNDVIFGDDHLNTPASYSGDYPQFNVSVLWLGYADAPIVNRFEKHGITVKSLFPCKENDDMMRESMEVCDVVLVPVFQEESLKYLRSNLNFQDEKVEVLNRVTVDTALIRVRTSCVRRGIIRPKGYDLAHAN